METVGASRMSVLQTEAEAYLPGGVGGAGRFNPSLGHSLYLKRADGARIYDVDDKEYIDFNLSHGACLLGHNHPAIRQAIEAALDRGLIAGYETEQTTELARKIVDIIPCAEKVRLANSGSEGTQLTLRLARGFTGRSKIVKFWGHFHGMYDYVNYNSHSPLSPVKPGSRVPLSQEGAGIPEEIDDLVIVVPWKDEEALAAVVREEGNEIAAIIMEPINYNQGCIVAGKDYMESVRKIADEKNIVLIYDEVLSAFRTGVGCAQEYYGVTPDLCVIAKAVANGAPIAVIAGKEEIMQQVTPVGHVSHSGTYAGNLISVMAANAALKEITAEGFYGHIYAVADRLYTEFNGIFARAGLPARVQGLGARFGIYFGFTEEVQDFADTFKHDSTMAARFARACANRGVYFHSYGKMVRGHQGISASHSLSDIDEALDRIETAVREM
jgi:glutamate-1-semialdehyde 2,1-aminomutase